jgi:hypothetical protein
LLLPEQKVNPLKYEQYLWNRLSPRVEVFLNSSNRWIKNYDETNPAHIEPAKRVVSVWWDIIQEWNQLSNSYRPKIAQGYGDSSPNLRRELKALLKSKYNF